VQKNPQKTPSPKSATPWEKITGIDWGGKGAIWASPRKRKTEWCLNKKSFKQTMKPCVLNQDQSQGGHLAFLSKDPVLSKLISRKGRGSQQKEGPKETAPLVTKRTSKPHRRRERKTRAPPSRFRFSGQGLLREISTHTYMRGKQPQEGGKENIEIRRKLFFAKTAEGINFPKEGKKNAGRIKKEKGSGFSLGVPPSNRETVLQGKKGSSTWGEKKRLVKPPRALSFPLPEREHNLGEGLREWGRERHAKERGRSSSLFRTKNSARKIRGKNPSAVKWRGIWLQVLNRGHHSMGRPFPGRLRELY